MTNHCAVCIVDIVQMQMVLLVFPFRGHSLVSILDQVAIINSYFRKN